MGIAPGQWQIHRQQDWLLQKTRSPQALALQNDEAIDLARY